MSKSFSEPEFIERLHKLNNTTQSIQGNSAWVCSHVKRSNEIVAIWKREILKATSERKLLYLYLCNDVIQASRKKSSAFVNGFLPVLNEVLNNLSGSLSSSEKPKVQRILEVWSERKVFNSEQCRSLSASFGIIQNALPPSLATHKPSKFEPLDDGHPLKDHPVVTAMTALSQCRANAPDLSSIPPMLLSDDIFKLIEESDEDSQRSTYRDLNDARSLLEKSRASLEEELELRASLQEALQGELDKQEQLLKETEEMVESRMKQIAFAERVKKTIETCLPSLVNGPPPPPLFSATPERAGGIYEEADMEFGGDENGPSPKRARYEPLPPGPPGPGSYPPPPPYAQPPGGPMHESPRRWSVEQGSSPNGESFSPSHSLIGLSPNPPPPQRPLPPNPAYHAPPPPPSAPFGGQPPTMFGGPRPVRPPLPPGGSEGDFELRESAGGPYPPSRGGPPQPLPPPSTGPYPPQGQQFPPQPSRYSQESPPPSTKQAIVDTLSTLRSTIQAFTGGAASSPRGPPPPSPYQQPPPPGPPRGYPPPPPPHAQQRGGQQMPPWEDNPPPPQRQGPPPPYGRQGPPNPYYRNHPY